MNYPLISEYIEAIKSAEENFEQLKHFRPVLDDDGQPIMSSGNFAVVFKMINKFSRKQYALKCFLKEQEGRAEAYRLIAEELERIRIASIKSTNNGIENIWTFFDFCRTHGRMKRHTFSTEVSSMYDNKFVQRLYFPDAKDGLIFLDFSGILGELSNEELRERRNELQVVQFENGRYELYPIGEPCKINECPYFTHIKYIDKELFVDSNASDETEFPVLLMDWVEGVSLDKYIREHIDDQYELSLLAYQFSRLAVWLIPQPFAHGDLKPDNILVREDGTLTLVDYDGMYVPAMKGQRARELGSPDFRHPSRTEDDFDEHIDDFSVVSILLSLKAIALQPSLFEKYGVSDRLLFSQIDYRNLSESKVLGALPPLMHDVELSTLLSLFILSVSQKNLSQVSFHLLTLSKPDMSQYEEEILSTEVTEEDTNNTWEDEYGVVYSKDKKRLLGVRSDYLSDYEIHKGTKVICNDALNGFWNGIEGFRISGNITIPSTVQVIGRNPFRGDYNNIICNSPYFIVENKALFTSDKKRLISCFSKSDVFVVPDGVEEIGSFAFYGCELSRIIIPKSVTTIGYNPFVEMNITSESPLEIICNSSSFFVKDEALYQRYPQLLISYWGESQILYVEEGSISINPYSFWYGNLNRIYFPSSIEKIPNESLYGSSFQQFYIPENTFALFETILPNYKDRFVEIDLSKVWIDEFGVKYSADKERLLEALEELIDYSIRKGTRYIASYAFMRQRKLKTFSIPNSIEMIGDYAFDSCTSLQSIVIPYNVKKIGQNIFSGCANLSSIVVDDRNVIYDSRQGCNAIIETQTEVLIAGCSTTVIPFGIKTIGRCSFSNCDKLKSITIPKSVVKIDNNAFGNCMNLAFINIPENVKEIDPLAFQECPTSIVVDKNNKNFDSRQGCNAIIHSGSNTLVIGNQSTIIPDDVKVIGKSSFRFCLYLKKITIPNSVTLIEYEAFAHCQYLESVMIPNSVKEIGHGSFHDCIRLKSATISNGIKKIGISAFNRCSSLTEIIIPESVDYVEDYAFYDCKQIITVTILNSKLSIGNEVFSGCDNLSYIHIPKETKSYFEKKLPKYKDILFEQEEQGGAMEIRTEVTEEEIANGITDEFGVIYSKDGKRLLKGKEMDDYYIKEGVQIICDRAFSGRVYGVKSIHMPNSLIAIGNQAFELNTMRSLTIPIGVKFIGDAAFKRSVYLESVDIPDTVTHIGKNAFSCCFSLKFLKISIGISHIDDYTFSDCESLSSIFIPNSVKSIGECVFKKCKSLHTINIPESVHTIGVNPFISSGVVKINCNSEEFETDGNAFYDKGKKRLIGFYGKNINSFIVPQTVEEIGEDAFVDNVSLQKIVIPKGCKIINIDAFARCNSLKSISIPDSLVKIGASAFCGCDSLRTISIPNSVLEIDDSAFYGCENLVSIKLPNNITKICDYTFLNCYSLRSILLPKSVRYIGIAAFKNCKSIESIIVPENVMTIEDSAFEGCSSLQSISILNNNVKVGDGIFYRCNSLHNTNVPSWMKIETRDPLDDMIIF